MSAQPVDTVPTLADYERSVRWARERAHAGDETLEICPHCLCEVDVDPQPHRPGCPGIGMPRATSVPVLANVEPAAAVSSPAVRPGSAFRDDGADALARMDAGERQEPVLEEREPQSGEVGVSFALPPASDNALLRADAVVEPGSQHGVVAEAASRSSSTRGWSRGKRWDEETVVAAIVRWHAEHGAPPTSAQWLNAADGYPSQSSVRKVFGSWAAGIEAAGFPRPTRGTRAPTAAQAAGRVSRESAVPVLALPAREPLAMPEQDSAPPEPADLPPLAKNDDPLSIAEMSTGELAACGQIMQTVGQQVADLTKPERLRVARSIAALLESAG
ncbi:MAG: homing endonuclease associated repeat-containing protein [Gaiellaceae bacterium]